MNMLGVPKYTVNKGSEDGDWKSRGRGAVAGDDEGDSGGRVPQKKGSEGLPRRGANVGLKLRRGGRQVRGGCRNADTHYGHAGGVENIVHSYFS
jgi:hypothetical protein